MQFKKHEIQTLNHLSFYKYLSIFLMVFSGSCIPFGLYASFFKQKSAGESLLNNALIGASLVVLGISYLTFYFIRIIEKLKTKVEI